MGGSETCLHAEPDRFHPPTHETTALAVEKCVTLGGIVSEIHTHASADFAHWRMTHRSLGACAPKRFSAKGRRWVWLLGTTGLPVGLHGGKFTGKRGDRQAWLPGKIAIRT